MKDRIIYNKFINVIIIKFTKTIIIDDIHFFYLTNIIYKPKILDNLENFSCDCKIHKTFDYIKPFNDDNSTRFWSRGKLDIKSYTLNCKTH